MGKDLGKVVGTVSDNAKWLHEVQLRMSGNGNSDPRNGDMVWTAVAGCTHLGNGSFAVGNSTSTGFLGARNGKGEVIGIANAQGTVKKAESVPVTPGGIPILREDTPGADLIKEMMRGQGVWEPSFSKNEQIEISRDYIKGIGLMQRHAIPNLCLQWDLAYEHCWRSQKALYNLALDIIAKQSYIPHPAGKNVVLYKAAEFKMVLDADTGKIIIFHPEDDHGGATVQSVLDWYRQFIKGCLVTLQAKVEAGVAKGSVTLQNVPAGNTLVTTPNQVGKSVSCSEVWGGDVTWQVHGIMDPTVEPIASDVDDYGNLIEQARAAYTGKSRELPIAPYYVPGVGNARSMQKNEVSVKDKPLLTEGTPIGTWKPYRDELAAKDTPPMRTKHDFFMERSAMTKNMVVMGPGRLRQEFFDKILAEGFLEWLRGNDEIAESLRRQYLESLPKAP